MDIYLQPHGNKETPQCRALSRFILGRQKLSSWASMLALSSLSDRLSEMIHIAVTRAKMCELADLIKPLPLNKIFVSALLEHKGIKGEALKYVLAYEISDTANATFLNLASYDIYVAQVKAITWANMVRESL